MAKLQVYVAAIGDMQAVFHRFGDIFKQFGHFLIRFQIIFRCKKSGHIAQTAILLQGDHGLKSLKIFANQKMGVVTGHQRDVQFMCHRNQLSVNIFLTDRTVSLQFKEKTIVVEHLFVGQRCLPSSLPVPFLQQLLYLPVPAG